MDPVWVRQNVRRESVPIIERLAGDLAKTRSLGAKVLEPRARQAESVLRDVVRILRGQPVPREMVPAASPRSGVPLPPLLTEPETRTAEHSAGDTESERLSP